MGSRLGSAALIALGLFVAASGCDHVHWLGILDAGGGASEGGSGPISDAASFDGVRDTVPHEVGGGDGGGGEAGETGAAGCPEACAAIMGCGLGGYGPYRAGVGYAYAYVIGPYAYASGYSSPGGAGYGAYGFRDLEYQQCVSTCEAYADCLGCGPASERDNIVSCVLANTCPGLLDCLAR
jgi:hypothetical protein